MAAITCVVVDDHPAVLDAVSRVLGENDIDVVARASNGEDGLAEIESKHPQVALVDVHLPRMNGVEVARRAGSASPETAVALYTGYGDRALLIEALDAGARAFILKEAPLSEVVRAVKTIAAGDTYVDPVIAGVLASAEATARLPQLTKREREVLRLLADGLHNEEVGKRLSISTETVRTHIRKAMEKLDADTRTQAVATALRQSLIS